MQWKIIDSVLNEKKDNLVVMATGYGKSLCYQFPSVYTGRVSVIVSPLLSLMEDQVLALSMSDISSCQLSSSQEDNSSQKDAILAGRYRVVYMTPERIVLDTEFLQSLHNKVGM